MTARQRGSKNDRELHARSWKHFSTRLLQVLRLFGPRHFPASSERKRGPPRALMHQADPTSRHLTSPSAAVDDPG